MGASYPTAAKSFTTKNTGDTIQPAHINDLQDEIAAIESGLLNGTAPVHSSHSTVAALSVTGGSTLATLQVAGNCTIAGTLTALTITSTSLVSPQASYAYLRLADPVEFSTLGAWSTLVFGRTVVDVGGEWDSTTGRFTAKSSGIYAITANVYIASHLGWSLLSILHDGTEYSRVSNNDTAAIELAMSNALIFNTDSGGYFQVRFYHGGAAGAMSTGRISTNTLTNLSIVKIA